MKNAITFSFMERVVEFALLHQEWHIRTRIGRETPSLDWLPSKLHSSYDRATPFCFAHAVAALWQSRDLPPVS
jgi:hypothetical protein